MMSVLISLKTSQQARFNMTLFTSYTYNYHYCSLWHGQGQNFSVLNAYSSKEIKMSTSNLTHISSDSPDIFP